jgi:hypothetical protein
MTGCLGLLLWAEPARAEVYSLKVSVHEDVRPELTKAEVRTILKKASRLLQRHCDVKFQLKDEIEKFASAPKDIKNARDLEAVHRVDADVKVVRKIRYCKGSPPWIGCAWRPEGGPKTMIVTRKRRAITHILWAHEFGHTKGLPHRVEERGEERALMTPCPLDLFRRHINEAECKCFREGCEIQEPEPSVTCPIRNR